MMPLIFRARILKSAARNLEQTGLDPSAHWVAASRRPGAQARVSPLQVCRLLYEVMTKLAEQHSDKVFTIQGAPRSVATLSH